MHARVDRRAFIMGAAAGAAALGFPAVLRAQARELKVGHIHPLSGFLAFDGGLVVNGLTLAVEEINAAGGIKSMGGAKLTLVGGDSQGKGEVGGAGAGRVSRAGAGRRPRGALARGAGGTVKAIAMLHEDGLFGTSVAAHVERHAKNLGMDLVLKVGYNVRTPDVTTEITKAKAARPDPVVVTGYFGDGLLIARTATEARGG